TPAAAGGGRKMAVTSPSPTWREFAGNCWAATTATKSRKIQNRQGTDLLSMDAAWKEILSGFAGVLNQFPRPLDMLATGAQVADRQAQREPAAEHCTRDEHFTAGIHLLLDCAV